MFAPVDIAVTVPITTSAPPVVQDVDSPELNGANADTTAFALEVPTPQKRQAKKNLSPASSKQGKKSPSTKKPITRLL